MAATPVAYNCRNEVVVAMANVVVVVAEAECGIRGHSVSDLSARRRTEMRRGVPG